jgi:hypothetical protein
MLRDSVQTNMDLDLQFILGEAGVNLEHQVAIAITGISGNSVLWVITVQLSGLPVCKTLQFRRTHQNVVHRCINCRCLGDGQEVSCKGS